MRYAFLRDHRRGFRLTTMCQVLRVHRSGYYAWMKTPQSRRAKPDARILKKIRTSYQASDGVYGSPRVHRDLREDGERCGEHRVARLMRINGLRATRGYKKPRYRVGKPAMVAPNRLEQNFSVPAPDRVWATDITYIRTFEGWLNAIHLLPPPTRAIKALSAPAC